MAAHEILMAAAGASPAANYIEDVFSTYLYTGNGSTQTITNGIDLSGKGGLVWGKSRSVAADNVLVDSARGIANTLVSNSTGAQNAIATAAIGSFNSNGFSFSGNSDLNANPNTYASWTFRKQAKFFDVVTFTSNGSGGGTFNHSLGSTPGCVILKSTGVASSWIVYHRSTGVSKYLELQSTAAEQTGTNWISVDSTSVTVGSGWLGANRSIVAYIFAHDAGGFGLTDTDNVISCGSVTLNSSGAGTVNLGYEPQWVLMKTSSSANDWIIFDTMRGFSVTGGSGYNTLNPNLSAAEFSGSSTYFQLTNTGFSINMNFAGWRNENLIYIAIRRGPMKVPTSGTSVFAPVAYTGTSVTRNITGVGFPLDMNLTMDRATHAYNVLSDRLRGLTCDGSSVQQPQLRTNTTDAEALITNGINGTSSSAMDGYTLYNAYTQMNASPDTYISYNFRRAPSFFDEVCYTGNGTAGATQTHNLGIVPELMIVKNRSGADGWTLYSATLGSTNFLALNTTQASTAASTVWNNTSPTSTLFSLGTANRVNASGGTYVAYLFATCAGVSKVGSYTGTGTTKQVNCGFTGGARFVLIKRTDSTGDWYVWDSARGIVAGNDPYLTLNTYNAEVTNTDYVDTYSAGFEISSTAPAAINASGGTFIFLAIA